MRSTEQTVTVDAPVERVYEMWTDWENFPRFMQNVEQVTVSGDMTHWRAKIFGTSQEWDARITDRTRNQRVAWESLTGATNNGTVSFIPSGNQTRVTVRIDYDPPAGVLGDAVDAVTNVMDRNVESDLKHFKQLIEQGASDAQVQGDTAAQEGRSDATLG